MKIYEMYEQLKKMQKKCEILSKKRMPPTPLEEAKIINKELIKLSNESAKLETELIKKLNQQFYILPNGNCIIDVDDCIIEYKEIKDDTN